MGVDDHLELRGVRAAHHGHDDPHRRATNRDTVPTRAPASRFVRRQLGLDFLDEESEQREAALDTQRERGFAHRAFLGGQRVWQLLRVGRRGARRGRGRPRGRWRRALQRAQIVRGSGEITHAFVDEGAPLLRLSAWLVGRERAVYLREQRDSMLAHRHIRRTQRHIPECAHAKKRQPEHSEGALLALREEPPLPIDPLEEKLDACKARRRERWKRQRRRALEEHFRCLQIERALALEPYVLDPLIEPVRLGVATLPLDAAAPKQEHLLLRELQERVGDTERKKLEPIHHLAHVLATRTVDCRRCRRRVCTAAAAASAAACGGGGGGGGQRLETLRGHGMVALKVCKVGIKQLVGLVEALEHVARLVHIGGALFARLVWECAHDALAQAKCLCDGLARAQLHYAPLEVHGPLRRARGPNEHVAEYLQRGCAHLVRRVRALLHQLPKILKPVPAPCLLRIVRRLQRADREAAQQVNCVLGVLGVRD